MSARLRLAPVRFAAVLLAGALATLLAPAAAATPTPPDPDAPAVDRTVTERAITEASGLVASARFPNVLWTHQDSGNPARIYAVGPNGGTAAQFSVKNVPNVDWEAITRVPDRNGSPVLVVGDIGDNTARRKEIRLEFVREPTKLADATLTPVRSVRLEYPDGPRDAEALLADADSRRLFVVTKGLVSGTVYAVPEAAWPGAGGERVFTLERVGDVAMGLVTDGAMLPDGRMVLRNYGSMQVFPAPGTAQGSLGALARADLPPQEQGESLAVVDNGRAVVVGSEGARQPIYRVPVPAAQGADPSGPSASSSYPHNGAQPTATEAAAAGAPAAGEGGLSPLFVQVALGSLAVLALLFAAVVIALR